MSRDLNLHVGALKRRAGRFKTLLKQLLLTLHSLQTQSREQVERTRGLGCCASPASVPLRWEPVSSGCSSCDCPQHKHTPLSKIHAGWCVFIESCSETGIVPVTLQLSCFHQVYLLFFHFKLFLSFVFGFLLLATFSLGLSSPSEYLSSCITIFPFSQFNYLLPQVHDKSLNLFLTSLLVFKLPVVFGSSVLLAVESPLP